MHHVDLGQDRAQQSRRVGGLEGAMRLVREVGRHDVHEIVVGFCRAERIRCLDLLPMFLAYEGHEQGLWVHPSDQHANHVGHAMQAEAIHAFLQREGLLE